MIGVLVILYYFMRLFTANPQSGILQPSIISLYVIYLTWSAITNDTREYAVCEYAWRGRVWSVRKKPLEILDHGWELNPGHRKDRQWDFSFSQYRDWFMLTYSNSVIKLRNPYSFVHCWALLSFEVCNPSLTEILIEIEGKNSTGNGTVTHSAGTWGQPIDGISIVTLIIWFIAITYAR